MALALGCHRFKDLRSFFNQIEALVLYGLQPGIVDLLQGLFLISIS